MKILKNLLTTSLILMVLCSLSLSSISAESKSGNSIAPTLYAKGNVAEKEIVIDVSHIESKPANLIADYNSDFKELVTQLIEQYPETQLLKSQFESGKSSSELKTIELDAKQLLESRYEDNNKNLRPEILAAAESNKMQLDTLAQLFSYDVVQYEFGNKTRTTGNYGSTSGDASYTHAANNNVSKVYAQAITLGTRSEAKSGWQFMAGIGYPNETFDVDLKFRYITFKGIAGCSGTALSSAVVEAATFIYDASANSLVGTAGNLGAAACTGNTFDNIDAGPTAITYTGFQIRNSHIYNAYIKSDATSFAGGIANVKNGVNGVKWEFIEVINFSNPKP
jgi:hypothetical protein